jgi:hypothetical protein
MPTMTRSAVVRGCAASLGLVAAIASMAVTSHPALASSRAETVRTTTGLVVTVTPTTALDPAGATVTVTGRGFDRTVGIYVALCVTPKSGQPPSPCGGGVNMSGANPASAWISSNPPPYGQKLAIPFAKGGRFKVRISVSSTIGTVDCRSVSCSIVTRADHLRSGDRRFDVAVPVTFRQ